ncbi:Pre-mRNA cleavage complex II protein Clp1-domain-containing protein [Cokeromyces recurvatus]|uniref:Pre-mRNA cleavage complex II protein Clp1-domain-containing protein n=1 Tax=Cokeromyces recurvatus TaxID=90255 RepID=UPI002220E60D|nr:Pre-mRNA cleavage complex II protein Clp1-domain-containing protein [Cokeromyces recurvatus]KAI7905566.1 Pre-mRNA cleavage complex II protein Clp1-domain-containing protein [Cokeromyces recurvatus]
MPLKRKNKISHGRPSKKTAKDHDLVAKAIQEQIENEARVIIKEKPIHKTSHSSSKTPARPMSAIAARKAAISAGILNKPSTDEKEENKQESENENENEDEENEVETEKLNTVNVISDKEEGIDDEELVKSPISGTTTPHGEFTPNQPSTPLNTLVDLEPKSKKIPLLIDGQSVSRFIPSKNNCCIINQEEETYLFLGLKEGEHIVFMGQVFAAPLYGSISIAGAVLSSGKSVPKSKEVKDMLVSFYPVFSPRTHSLLSIASVPLDTPSIRPHEDTVELDEYLIEAVFDELFKVDQKFESIVVIKDFPEDSGLENIRESIGHIKRDLVRFTKKESSRDKSVAINLLRGFHPILSPTPGVRAFQVDSSWESRTTVTMKNSSEREIVSVVCGAKDTGKSSFSRYLINRLLAKYKRVAYIETDVGQSEFTPAGLLTLHYVTQPVLGPSYTHQHLEPERSFFLGSTSPRHDPDYYLACIYELIEHWRQEDMDTTPLVVNTQGWVSGVGYNLLLNIIRKVIPTDIFMMYHPLFEYKNLPPTFQSDVTMPSPDNLIERTPPLIHYISSLQQQETVTTLSDAFSAAQQREITLASYFYQLSMGHRPDWDFKQHLVERIPWVVDWRKNLNAIWVIYEQVKMNELFYALNGSIVGLIGDVVDYKPQPFPNKKKSNNDDNDTFTLPNYYDKQDQLPPQPQSTTCYGLAIIRAIDPSRHAFLLLTPVPLNKLKYVSGLVKGELQLPLWAVYNREFEKKSWQKIPYITQENTEGVGANALRVRRNLLRRSQQQ